MKNVDLTLKASTSQEWEFRRPDGSIVDVYWGPVISGQKLVDDVEFKSNLFVVASDAIAGEMEGAGLYSSASSLNTPWIVVKGVSDWGDGKKHKDYQMLAATAAASLTKLALNRLTF
jgi:Nucleoside phosphorylase